MWQVGYRLLLWLAFPWVVARLWWRGRAEPGYRQKVGERFGFYGAPPAKPVIWLHAVSVGETRAAEPLVRALRMRHPECELLLTQMTATGRETAQQVYGDDVRVAWLAYDYPFAVRRFLRHFRPRQQTLDCGTLRCLIADLGGDGRLHFGRPDRMQGLRRCRPGGERRGEQQRHE